MERDEKKCWICKRILVGDAQLGLCPDCLNKYGSVAAVVGTTGLFGGARYVIKNPELATKFLAMSGKYIMKHTDQLGKITYQVIKATIYYPEQYQD